MKNFNGKVIALFALVAVSLSSCNEEVTVTPSKKVKNYSSSNQENYSRGDLDPISVKDIKNFQAIPETTRVVEIIIEK